MRRPFVTLILSGLCLLAAGCDQLGIEAASTIAARKEADGKAVGGACRHAGRAIEDCYVLNRKADRAAVYAGWREMNEYMRENKLEAIVPQIEPDHLVAAKAPDAAEANAGAETATEKAADNPADKHGEKADAKAGNPAAARHKRQPP